MSSLAANVTTSPSPPQTTPRSVLRAVSVKAPKTASGPFGIARPLAALDLNLDPFLMVDWFRGDQDPFGPHPHAGFSAVSWILPDSEGAVRNRDTLGDDSVFGAGELHWFEAARGAIHNETPQGVVHGLQIFVNLPQREKHSEPRTYRGTTDSIPVVNVGDSRVRIVVGSAFGVTSPIVPRTPNVAIVDVDVDGHLEIPVPRGRSAFAIVTAGAVSVSGSDTDDNAVALNDDGDVVSLRGKGHVVFFHGQPLREPMAVAGPFVMGTRDELRAVIKRYERGELGYLAELGDLEASPQAL